MKNYQIALTNVDFDNSYENCIRFDSRAQQEAYFKVNTLFADAPVVNLDFGTLLNSRVTIRRDLIPTKLMGYNYLIVKDTSTDRDLDYLYYFVKDIYYDSSNQAIFDIELDVINTYLLDVNFSDCFIEKAHLNRFIDNGDDTVSFDGTPDSKLFETEDIADLPKLLTKRTKIDLKFTDKDDVDNWLNTHVAYWVYIFLDKNQKYHVTKMGDTNNTRTEIYLPTTEYLNYICDYDFICYPVMKSGSLMIRYNNSINYTVGATGLTFFEDANAGVKSHYYSIKFSLVPPFWYLNDKYSIVGNTLQINLSGTSDEKAIFGGTSVLATYSTSTPQNSGRAILSGTYEPKKSIESFEITTDNKYTFNKSEIIDADKDIKFNPKLLNEKMKELKLVTQGESFNYDNQKINSNKLKFLYTEPIQSEITKFYFRLKAPTGLYVDDTDNNFMGVVGNVDNSQAIANDQYSNFLANNKNFWLQSNIKITERSAGGLIGGLVGGAVVGNIPGMIAGGITGIGGGLVSGITGAIDRNLTIDNMRNAPSMMKNANGNAIFNMQVNDLALYMEEYDALSNEKEMVNDVMFKNGFTVNRIGQINDYLNIRKYFNYIRARLENITSTLQLNNNVREKFKMIFANGVRFWNITDRMFEYKKENYENWLEEANDEEL